MKLGKVSAILREFHFLFVFGILVVISFTHYWFCRLVLRKKDVEI